MDSPSRVTVIGEEYLKVDDSGRVRLIVSENHQEDSRWYPPRESVGVTSHLPLVEVGPLGTVYASTVVRIGPARFEPPYVLSYIDVDGVRVLAHSPGDQALRPGETIELILSRVGSTSADHDKTANDDPTELHSYVATPVEGHDS